jgi:hypothetical protein
VSDDKITQADIDCLADIIWWIKGFRAGCNADFNSCPFDSNHSEALRKTRARLIQMQSTEEFWVKASTEEKSE